MSWSLELKPEVHAYLERSFCNPQACAKHGPAACSTRWSCQLSSLTQPPMYSTLRVNTTSCSVKEAKQRTQEALDRHATTRGESPHLTVETIPEIPDLLVIPHTGPHERDRSLPAVVVGLGCGMAVLRGADVFCPGIMGAPQYLQKGALVSVFADVDGKCLRGALKPYAGRTLFVGNGVMNVDRKDVFCTQEKLGGVGITMTQPVYVAPSLSDLLPDLVFPQNLPSTVCSHLLDPRPGDHVLDMCAAPGGKTTHLATLMKNQGTVVALDKSKNKLKLIEENARRWGLTNIRVYGADATRAHHPQADMSGPPPYPSESFERIMLDAPCSALGQRPALKNTMKLTEVKSFPVLQRKLIDAAVRLLKPGGTLVYSTCTLPLEENEEQVEYALNTYPELSLVSPACPLGSPGLPGSGLSRDQLSAVQRFGLVPAAMIATSQSAATATEDICEAAATSAESVPMSARSEYTINPERAVKSESAATSDDDATCEHAASTTPTEALMASEPWTDTIGFFCAKFVKRK